MELFDHSETLVSTLENPTFSEAIRTRHGYRDRIIELRRVRAGDLVPHPEVFRIHPESQRAAVRGSLEEVGYSEALVAMKLPDGRLMLINGHMRADLDPEAWVPVVVLDVTREEADKLLLMLDPIAEMAQRDSERIKSLLSKVQTDNEALRDLFRRLAGNRIWDIIHPDEVREVEV